MAIARQVTPKVASPTLNHRGVFHPLPSLFTTLNGLSPSKITYILAGNSRDDGSHLSANMILGVA